MVIIKLAKEVESIKRKTANMQHCFTHQMVGRGPDDTDIEGG